MTSTEVDKEQAPEPEAPETPASSEPELAGSDPARASEEVSSADIPKQWTFPELPPPPPGFLTTRWTGPSYGGGPAAWLSALAGGIAAAVALPLAKPGVGWLIVGLVITIAVTLAARYAPKLEDRSERLIQIGWAVLALALLSVGVFLNAYWLFYICVFGAIGCASLALAGGHSVRALIMAAVALPLGTFRSIPWLVKGAGAWQKTRDKTTATSRTLWAVVVTIVLVVVFGALFASADVAFSRIVSDILPDLEWATFRRAIFYVPAGMLVTAGAIFIILAPPDLSGLEQPARRKIGRIELVLPLGAMTLLFAGFVAVQFSFLFQRKAPEGVTYASYAVDGFFQLVVVTLLTLLVIACASRWSAKETPQDRTVLRVLLAVLVLLSMIIVASAVYRMWLYMNELGWTRERLFFGAVEIYLGGVFLLVLLAGYKLRAPWFPRAIVASFALMLIGIAAVNPERYIAEQNIDRFLKNQNDPSYLQTFDLGYLQFQTSDAIGELDRLKEPYKSCALKRIEEQLRTEPETWYSWNLSRFRAREVLAGYKVDPQACAKWAQIRDNSR
jgi:hypothetical protein